MGQFGEAYTNSPQTIWPKVRHVECAYFGKYFRKWPNRSTVLSHSCIAFVRHENRFHLFFLFQNCSVAILRKNLHLRWSIKGFKANKPSQHAWQKVYIFHIEKCLYKKRKNLAKSYIVSHLIIFQHIKTIKHILCHLPDAPNIFLPPPPSTQPFAYIWV